MPSPAPRILRPSRCLPALRVAAALVLAAPVAAVAAATAEGASWSVGPAPAEDGTPRANFDLAMQPGETHEDGFVIRNDGAASLTLDVSAADAYTTREGSLDLPPAGTPSVDSGLWITLGTDRVTLAPGEQTVVPLTISVPADATPGDHPAGVVATLRTSGDGQVAVDRRLGSRINLRVAGELEPGIAVGAPTVDYDGTWSPLGVGTVEIVYDLTNTGNTRVTAVAAARTAGPFDLAAVSGAPEQLAELTPGSTVEIRQTLPGVAALFLLRGEVVLDGQSVGIGMQSLEPVVVPFELVAAPAVPLLALAGAATVAIVVVLLVRRRRADRTPPGTDGPGTSAIETAPDGAPVAAP